MKINITVLMTEYEPEKDKIVRMFSWITVSYWQLILSWSGVKTDWIKRHRSENRETSEHRSSWFKSLKNQIINFSWRLNSNHHRQRVSKINNDCYWQIQGNGGWPKDFQIQLLMCVYVICLDKLLLEWCKVLWCF